MSPDYNQTVGEVNRYRQGAFSSWPGDPARAAQIITDLVRPAEPPLRLLLGAAAVASAAKAATSRAAEADAWANVSRSADFAAALPQGGVAPAPAA